MINKVEIIPLKSPLGTEHPVDKPLVVALIEGD